MNNQAIGIISSNYRCDSLLSLSGNRPIAAIPFGGRYRFLDFVLSNMVNSGVKTVGIITPQDSRAILDHIGAGKAWSLDRKTGGMFILPGSTFGLHSRNNKFSLKDLAKNIEYLERDYAEYVIMSASNNIYNVDYAPILICHEERKADCTLLYKEMSLETEPEEQGFMVLTNGQNQVLGLESIEGMDGQKVKIFTDTFIMSRKLLIEIIKKYEYIENLDLLDVLKENIKNLTVQAYPVSGYYARISSIQSYYRRSMDLLIPSIRNELFMGINRIHTKIKDNPPTKYGSQGMIQDSLISSGCLIEGNITGSIVSRGVQVEQSAEIHNSIIMQKCIIRKGAILENVILDKFVEVRGNTVMKGKEDNPMIISKRMVV